ncbi:hypothetical protein AY599_22835 [Leptolyngbya valderiana BDU 20041]|nr:hypothetical protein AY599_22835 [Leptolyngbya valderiana BDU 20041]
MFAKDKRKNLDKWQKCYETIDRYINFNQFEFTPDFSTLDRLPLPQLSFLLRVPFKLKKPYLSKDDRPFHLLDNPVRKDKVFQTPMVAPSSWKGALRAALWQLEYKEENEQIVRLFGNARDNEQGQAGYLYFYPTFFDKMGLEVINPHDRKKGTGKNPILLESVPIGTTGDFVILYVPFGKIKEIQVARDLELVVRGVEAMLAVYGFGAKTSSGFGVVEDRLNEQGILAIQADIPELKQPEPAVKPPEPDLPRYLIAPGQIDPEFLNPDGSFKSKEQYLQGKSAKKAGQLYDKARKWWDSEQRKLTETAIVEINPEPEPSQKPNMTEVSFEKLSELESCAQQIGDRLSNGGQV